MRKIRFLRGAAFICAAVFVFFALPSAARDPVEDEFNALAEQIAAPPAASWIQYAYSTNSMPLPGERDPVDVLLRRTRTLLNDLDSNGLLGGLDQNLIDLETENETTSVDNTAERLALFRRIETVSRQVAFANPLIGFKDIVFLKRHRAAYDHMCDQYFGFQQQRGGGIYILENAFSDRPVLRDVLADSICENGRFQGQKLVSGSFLSPSLSFDGKTIYFCHTEIGDWDQYYRYKWSEHTTFHIFRVNVDGSGLRQLTDGPVNDLFPCQLPSGRIVFCSERRGGYGRCHPRKVPSYTLYSMNADGTDITLLSAHETNEWHPSVNNDGMIVYTRWDYVDRGNDTAHHPWITYPDGRDARAIHGNWKLAPADSPSLEQHVRAVPDSHKYIATATAHHGQDFGSLVLIDPRVEDDNKMSPLKVLTPEAKFPESNTGGLDDWKFTTAWALSERFYLCGYDPGENNHAITLIDAQTGLKTVLYQDDAIPCYYPIPLIPRRKPPVIPHRVASGLPMAPGEIFDPSVYDDIPTNGNLAVMNVFDSTLPFPVNTTITSLRIIEILPKTTIDHVTPHIGYAQEDSARRVLGTVPVESDGSAYFTLPADTPVYFQALNENGMAVQSMRSLTYVKPGETLTCAGCHEKQGNAPAMSVQPSAVQRAPSLLTPEYAGSNPFSYPRLVQPVLDAKCVTCHQAEGAMDLSAGDYTNNLYRWYTSYHSLGGGNLSNCFGFFYGAYAMDDFDRWNPTTVSTPGEVGAMASRLYKEVLSVDHHGLQLTAEELRRITLWLDCNSDFFGAYENTLAQAQGQIVQPINPQITGYQTVTNTVYGPAIPAESAVELGNNDGLSEYGTLLDLALPQQGGTANRPVTVGTQAAGGQATPLVEAGPDAIAYTNRPISLAGSATISGQPVVTGTVIVAWTQVAGPAPAVFESSSSLSTPVQFSQPGSYIFRLTVSNGVVDGDDDVLVTVVPVNPAPLVDAGPDRTVVLSPPETTVMMEGFALDDGDNLSLVWTQISGPGSVVFNNPSIAAPSVEFSGLGTYVLRLTADDGEHTDSDECTIYVWESLDNQPPTVSAGDDITQVYSTNAVTLQGSASDSDGPNPLVTTWSFVSGPGTVTFGDTNSPVTTATFSGRGYYLLQLTADDGERVASDQLAVYLHHNLDIPSAGYITWECWTNLPGSDLTNLTAAAAYPNRPNRWGNRSSFQAPSNRGDKYGTRMHGYLLPTVTGNYTFWIASDGNSQLWLSTDRNPSNAVQIASVTGTTTELQWDKYPSQQSITVSLTAGVPYYILALQKEDTGADHLAVAWEREGSGITKQVIDGNHLVPFPYTPVASGRIMQEIWTGIEGSSVVSLTSSAKYQNAPDKINELTLFEIKNPDNSSGTRVRGFLHPAVSGDYTFWVASDTESELWLSIDEDPNNAIRIASVIQPGRIGWTDTYEWDKYTSQQSTTFSLTAGKTYFIQVLYKTKSGSAHMEVAWQGPGISQSIIPGAYLSEYRSSGVWVPPSSSGVVVSPRPAKPVVTAGPDQTGSFYEQPVILAGQQIGSGTFTAQWSKAGGPGSVIFSNDASPNTAASFSAPGTYLLRLQLTDGINTDDDTVLVTLTSAIEHDYIYSSPQEVAWSPDGTRVAAADVGLNRVVIIDVPTQTVLRTVPVEGSPRGMVWETTNELWICEYDAGTLAKMNVASGRIVKRIDVGPKPYDVKIDSLHGHLIVTEYGLAQVRIIDLLSGGPVATVPVVTKPMYLAVATNNSIALVANSEPSGDARDVSHAAVVSVINLSTYAENRIALPQGSTSLRGIAISPNGKWGYVAHLLGRTYLPTSMLNKGWIFNNVITILDLASNTVYSTVSLDAVDEGAANPWGLALIEGGDRLWVCGSGVHELISLNLSAIHGYLDGNSQRQAAMDYDLITLYENGWINRYPLPGNGPRGLAASPDESLLATASYFGGEVELFDTASRSVAASVRTGPVAPAHALRRGEQLYFDGDGCYQRWLSCSSCHPFARSDGLNWDLLNDGIGNPKNTLSHLFSPDTPPSMSTGVRPSVAAAIEAGFKFIQFQQRSKQEMQDVYDYLASLRPEASPTLNKTWMTSAARRGRTVFNDPVVKCATCHSGPYFTNLQKYNVGTGHPADIGPLDPVYDTPGLRELWRTAPYLHDGSAPTLRDVLTTQNLSDQHGVTSHLTGAQIDDLVAYLEQIDGMDGWVNQPPAIHAGSSQRIVLPDNTVQLDATVSDEGLPASVLNLNWVTQSGPSDAIFDNSTQANAVATFIAAGEYLLAVRADDGELSSTGTVSIVVLAEPDPNDMDLDRMSDAWENHYFGGTNSLNGAASDDWDEDGLSNLFEYLTGTDPTDPDSGFYVRITSNAGQIIVEFTANAAGNALTPGQRFFTLQSCVPSGTGLNWSNIPGYVDLSGEDQIVRWAGSDEKACLFRVMIRLQSGE